ncbi:hypothetical protein [Nostoc sp.]|uniref:hypothetical protein n=1 Tax=Nostoc sp. TaxID=1180 RepID=UPI002FF99794
MPAAGYDARSPLASPFGRRLANASLSASRYEFFPPAKSCINTVMARLLDLLNKNHPATIAG